LVFNRAVGETTTTATGTVALPAVRSRTSAAQQELTSVQLYLVGPEEVLKFGVRDFS
jgi:hypothetical protein